MRRSIAAMLLMLTCVAAADDWNETPEALVHQFQVDYFAWNRNAFATGVKLGMTEATPIAESEYRALLRKYTMPSFAGEPVSFGSESSYDPVKERILSVNVTVDRAVVRTELPRENYSPVYDYELVNSDGRWYLAQIYLVDDDGRHPGL